MLRSSREAASRARWGRLRKRTAVTVLVIAVLAMLAINAPRLHLLGSEPFREFPTTRRNPSVAAVFLSGDMGFNFGIGADVAEAMAEHGMPVLGVSTPVVFARHRSRAETQAVLAGAIERALAGTGAKRVVLMGQSYGADIVATAAPDLPPELRAKVAAIDLAVPGREAYFRADPSNIAYLGEPDARPAEALRALDWAPVICIHGVEETGSLCPALKGTTARVIGLPGGHFLKRDPARLIATTLAALRAADPSLGL